MRDAASAKAENAKRNVVERLRNGLKELLGEIKSARSNPDKKLPKVTFGSIAARAGIDRRTLNQRYHSRLKEGVRKFIVRYDDSNRHLISVAPPKIQRPVSRNEAISRQNEELAIENRLLRRENFRLKRENETLRQAGGLTC